MFMKLELCFDRMNLYANNNRMLELYHSLMLNKIIMEIDNLNTEFESNTLIMNWPSCYKLEYYWNDLLIIYYQILDILIKNNEIWKDGIFEAKVFHIPGHTLGHVCFYFFKENALFSGDTLFSLGCGRVFEGTHEEMFNSLQLIKSLPLDTEIYCGHEYTLKNSDFCLKYDSGNKRLISKIESVKNQIAKGRPTIPSTLEEELQTNIFLRSKNVKNFSKLRDLKDNF